jgi:hypothetical protein
MLKCYYQSYGGRGAPCHTTSPYGLIPPPIKQLRILVSCVVVIVRNVSKNLLWLLDVWLRRMWLHVAYRKIPVSRHPPTRAKVTVALCAANKIGLSSPSGKKYFYHDELSTFDFRLPAFHFI